jgi:hypothetical protein
MENTRKFLKRGLRKVIAIWGDGTINEVLRRFSLEMNAKMIKASLQSSANYIAKSVKGVELTF